MNEIVNKFLLTGDKSMSAVFLIQPGITYTACRPLTKHCKRIQKFYETSDLIYIYKNQLGKAVLLMILDMLIAKI